MALKLITGPSEEPISITEAKAQLRVDWSTEDTQIGNYILAAREYCEGFQNRQYITATWDLWMDGWPSKDRFGIPLPPLQSVASIKYYDTANVEATMAAADYFVDDKSEPARVVLAYGTSWPSITLRPANGVVVRFTAGYGLAAEVPQKVKQAMLLLITLMYEKRLPVVEGKIVGEVPFAVSSLLWLDRIVPV